MGPDGSENFNTVLRLSVSSYKSQPTSFKLILNFLPKVLTTLCWGFLKFSVSVQFLTIFFRTFQIHHCTIWKKPKPQLIGNQVIAHMRVVVHVGVPWPCSIQRRFRVIRCTCDFSDNTIFKRYFLYKSQPKFIKLLLNHILNSHHNAMIGIF